MNAYCVQYKKVNNLKTTPKNNNTFIRISIGSALGLGLSPIMPGTFGALLGVVFHILIVWLLPSHYQLISLFAVFLCVCIANHVLYPWAKEYWQSTDPKNFVLDEVAGYLFVPILFRQGDFWPTVIWGFVLFRCFDMIKLPIARQIDQNIHNAWGVILDDLVSAIYAVIVLFFLSWFGAFEIGGITIYTP